MLIGKKLSMLFQSLMSTPSFYQAVHGSSLLKRDFPTEIGRLECNILGKEYFIVSENTHF